MNEEERRLLATVIRNHRWAALASQGAEGPECSWVGYVTETDFSGFWLFLSQLASHTGNLLRQPRSSLAISEREVEGRDPQLLARVMLRGEALPMQRGTDHFRQAAQLYQARLPESKRLFAFGDFVLFRFVPVEARFVAGFGQAYSLDGDGLRKVAALSGA